MLFIVRVTQNIDIHCVGKCAGVSALNLTIHMVIAQPAIVNEYCCCRLDPLTFMY
jgi:hypothetical protein